MALFLLANRECERQQYTFPTVRTAFFSRSQRSRIPKEQRKKASSVFSRSQQLTNDDNYFIEKIYQNIAISTLLLPLSLDDVY